MFYLLVNFPRSIIHSICFSEKSISIDAILRLRLFVSFDNFMLIFS